MGGAQERRPTSAPKQGKVRYVGCSNFTAWLVCKGLWVADRLNAVPFMCAQNPYSLMDRRLEGEMFGLVRDQGLGIMAYSPLGSGLLSGAYRPGEEPSPDTLWGSRRRELFESTMSGKTASVLETLRQGASEGGEAVTSSKSAEDRFPVADNGRPTGKE